jgi:hypothetical protein
MPGMLFCGRGSPVLTCLLRLGALLPPEAISLSPAPFASRQESLDDKTTFESARRPTLANLNLARE